jgi:hypothetical protein
MLDARYLGSNVVRDFFVSETRWSPSKATVKSVNGQIVAVAIALIWGRLLLDCSNVVVGRRRRWWQGW